jgi:pilus assembly protein FimV
MLECRAVQNPDALPRVRRDSAPRMSARSIILVAGLTGVFCAGANALGIVRAPAHVTLGATLNFAVAVQVASDESLTSQCVTAEVQQGDQRVPPSTLRIQIEPGPVLEERIVRITSTTAIEEPFVNITIGLGCGNRLERRFTVLADPPLVTVAAAPEPGPPVARSDAPVVTQAPRSEPAAPAPAAAADATVAAPSPPPATAAVPRTPAPRTTTAPRSTGAASAPARRVARATPSPAPTAAAPTARAAPSARTAESRTPSGPRLQLDPVEPAARPGPAASTTVALQEAQVRVAAVAASAVAAEQAASAAVANADAAADRMRQIEEGVAKLRADIERDREQMLTLRTQLARAQTTSKLAPWLGAGMALMAALALWLWLRMRRLQREQQAQWWAASRQAANSKQPPINPPTLQPMTLPPHMAPATPPTRPAVAPARPPVTQAPPGRTQSPAFRDSLFTSQQETRDVSIEELIDLEQQAEFFVVLGQDDAAIDLLIGHIRATGGTSPLPYLKLLEIYRRLGDRESYERTRERFNHRFNAYAPDWDFDLQHGRSLDEYPGIVQRLQQAWASPLDAMAELEALMFRRDGGELFELPAYREVLFLYSMARDLLDHQGGPPTSIDVLLPLTETPTTFEPTTARPHLFTSATGLAELSRATDPPIEVLQPSMPLEFDDRPSGSTGAHGVVDLDPTKPLPMDDTVVFRREDIELSNPDQRSDFADLPPPPAPKRK